MSNPEPKLPAHLEPISRMLWLDLIMRADIPTNRMAVAIALARFGDTDGTKVFPGMQKVADVAKVDVKTASNHVKALVSLDLLHMVRKGGGRGGSTNGYRLTRPADLSKLPLWLDPEFDRVPEGAGFVPLAAEKHRALAPDETTEHRASVPDETSEYRASVPDESPVDNRKHRASAPDETPVDNSGSGETSGVRPRNIGNSAPKHRALAPEDPSITPEAPQNPAGSPQVSTSPVAKIVEKQPAISDLVIEPESDAWIPEPSPPPRIVGGAAGLTPASGAHEAALAVLGAIPGGARFFAGRAVRQLTAEGIEPTPEAVAIRAAALVAAPNSGSRSA